MTLKQIFLNLQIQMIQKLSSNREIIFHSTTKGDASELNWIDWLRNYLPRRYEVDKAFIIDSENNFSEQIDLVIYDRQYSPFVLKQDGAVYIPAESVYAIFEIKQTLNKENLEYAIKKIKSVRLLKRTSAPIVHAGGKIPTPKLPFKIIGGILTLSSDWKTPIENIFSESIMNLDDDSQIDICCILENTAFNIEYINAIHNVESSSNGEVLIFFFLKLLARLQQLGTVPAMDINAYASSIGSFNHTNPAH